MAKRRLTDLPAGPDPPTIVNVVIETPKGSKNKYEYSEELDSIILDRILHSSVMYPLAYGFMPGTRYLDGDPIDVMVLMSEPVHPGCVVRARPIGLLRMTDSGQQDDKVLAAVIGDPKMKEVKSLKDLSEHELMEIEEFFRHYTRLEKGRKTEVRGWASKEEAFDTIADAIRRRRRWKSRRTSNK